MVQTVGQQLYRFAFKSIKTAIFQNDDDAATLVDAGIIKSRTNVVRVNGSGVPLDIFKQTSPSSSPIRFVMGDATFGE